MADQPTAAAHGSGRHGRAARSPRGGTPGRRRRADRRHRHGARYLRRQRV